MPDTGGTWSPALASGSGIFDPSIDTPGIYTYTIDQPECNLSDSATVEISLIENPVIDDLIISIPDTCLGSDVTVSFSGLNLIEDGDYNISYDITGPASFSNSETITVIAGSTSFIISSMDIENGGTYQFTLTDFTDADSNCNANLDNLSPLSFEVLEVDDPDLIEGGNFFCPRDNATISDLSNNIIFEGTIEWYDSAENGTLLEDNDVLQDGGSYFASVTNSEACTTLQRLEVLVSIGPCEDDIIIPDGFSPNNDGINDTFVIQNLDEFYPDHKVIIYNRYGTKLFQGGRNSPKWDGTSSESSIGSGILPVGVYFFIIEFNDGLRDDKQGRVYLSR